jgi:hypothetical protein
VAIQLEPSGHKPTHATGRPCDDDHEAERIVRRDPARVSSVGQMGLRAESWLDDASEECAQYVASV